MEMTVFSEMRQIAEDALAGVECGKYTQAIILRTCKGNTYHAVITDALAPERTEESVLIDHLVKNDDTAVEKILCVWHNGAVDLPSYAFRKALLETNAANADAMLFVRREHDYAEVKLAQRMK